MLMPSIFGENLFDDFFDDFYRPAVKRAPRREVAPVSTVMKTDVKETADAFELDIDLPGYKKEDVKISLYNGTLTISAEHNETNEEKDAKGRILRQERYSGNCSRSFYVGDAVKDSDVHASFNNGVLRIEIPTAQRKEQEEKKFIDIL